MMEPGTGKVKYKRGSPEHREYLRQLGAKGGRATHAKHPGHLKEIAVVGGRASKRKPKPKPETLQSAESPDASEKRADFLTEYERGLIDIDAFFADVEHG